MRSETTATLCGAEWFKKAPVFKIYWTLIHLTIGETDCLVRLHNLTMMQTNYSEQIE